jgi:isopentenyldiphosphate isomerase
MEVWDIYDTLRQKTQRTHKRGDIIARGDYHLVIHVWIINDKREFLIQKRQPWKVSSPNMWDCAVAGCTIAGENTKETAIRETKEELGIDLDIHKSEIFSTFKSSSLFDDIWIVRQNINISDLKLQYEEVADAKWVKGSEIEQLISNGEFIKYDYIDRLFNMIFNM